MATYTELCTQLQDTVEGSYTEDQLASFFHRSEQVLYNTVQLPVQRRNVTGTLTAGNQYLAAPNDMLSVFSLAVILPSGSYAYLLDKDANFIREAYPNPTTTGIPKHYAIFGPQSNNPNEITFILGPAPTEDMIAELHYNAYPESIVTAGQTWLGDNFDIALLNGALVEAARFIKAEADIVQMYDQRFTQSVALLKNLSDGKLRQDTYRSGQTRVKVN